MDAKGANKCKAVKRGQLQLRWRSGRADDCKVVLKREQLQSYELQHENIEVWPFFLMLLLSQQSNLKLVTFLKISSYHELHLK